jgi:hypothetical protein
MGITTQMTDDGESEQLKMAMFELVAPLLRQMFAKNVEIVVEQVSYMKYINTRI